MFSSPTHHEAFFLSSSSLAPHSKNRVRNKGKKCTEVQHRLLFRHFFCSCNIGVYVHADDAIPRLSFPLITRHHIFREKHHLQTGFLSFSAFLKAKISAWKARREYIVRSCFRQKPYCACINALTRRALRGIILCGTRNEISLMHHPTRRLSVSPRLCSGYWYQVLSCHSQPSLALLVFHHILVQAKANFSVRDENFHWQTIIKVEAREHYRKPLAMNPLCSHCCFYSKFFKVFCNDLYAYLDWSRAFDFRWWAPN